MVYSNAKDETQAARGTQAVSWDSYNPDRAEGVGCESKTSGCKSLRIGGTNRKRRNLSGTIGSSPDSRGGTLAQLIKELEEDLAESEERVERIRYHLQKVRLLANQLGDSE